MRVRDMPIVETWTSTRNDALDVFEITNAQGRLVAMIPIGNTSAEVMAQLKVRDLIIHSPALLGASHWHLERQDTASRSFLERAVRLASPLDAGGID